MVIFAIMSAGMFAVFNSFQLVKERTDRDSMRLSELQRAFRFIAKDVQQAVARPVRDEYGSPERLPAMVSLNDQLEFTRTGWNKPAFLNRKRSELQRVKYAVEEGKLKRFYWYVLDRAEDSTPKNTVLMDGVESIRFKFYRITEQKRLLEELTWPPQDYSVNNQSESENGLGGCNIESKTEIALPEVVELIVTLEDLGEISRKFLVAGEYENVYEHACS